MNPPEAVETGVRAAHVDADLLVLHKPPGLLCVPGRGPDKQDCLSARAQQRWPGALVVHRLDQATSGLVLMARHPDAQRRLSHAFAERQVHKRYQAVVQVQLSGDDNTWQDIDLPIAADWARRPLRVIDHALGKPSLTLIDARAAARYRGEDAVLMIRSKGLVDGEMAPELWVIPDDGVPKSLGFVPHEGEIRVTVSPAIRALRENPRSCPALKFDNRYCRNAP